jgi:hypothetical protein
MAAWFNKFPKKKQNFFCDYSAAGPSGECVLGKEKARAIQGSASGMRMTPVARGNESGYVQTLYFPKTHSPLGPAAEQSHFFKNFSIYP